MTTERMKRRQVEERYAAVLRFYMANPDATGDEAQDALTHGKLGPPAGPPMNIGQLYRLRRQALQLAKSGAPGLARPAGRSAPKGDIDKELRALVNQVQKLLVKDSSISDVTITRSDAHVARSEVRREKL